MIKKSNLLNNVQREDGNIIYHSLYGNACLMDHEAVKLLDYFETPHEMSNFINSLPKEKQSMAIEFINELKERCFIVTEDFDERIFLKRDMDFREKNFERGYLSRVLQLVTSNTCNFRCKYCFEKSMYKDPTRIEHQTEEANQYMSFEIAKKAMDNMIALLKKNNNKVLTVEFFGGEPLTNWKLVKQVLETYGNGDDELSIVYSITTNGSLITEEVSSLFKKYHVTVTISFDSPQSTERIRLDGKTALEILIPKLKILSKDKNWVTFNSVISQETMDNYDEIGLVDFAKENNVSMIGLILDLDLKFYSNEKNRKEVLQKLWKTYDYARKNNIQVVGYWHQIFNQIIGKQGNILQTGYKTCPATGCKISVEPAGHVYICKCCSKYLGEVDKFEDVLKTDGFKAYSMRAYLNSEACTGCEIEGFCSGVCMGGLEKKYEKLYGIEESSCEIFKAITKKLLENVNKDSIDIMFLEDDLVEYIR